MKAQTAVALLRGINVGGKNLLPMKSLAEIFTAAGCTDVKTYIQSGNVIFRHPQTDEVAPRVRTEIATQFGLNVPVIVRSSAEMIGVLERNPFLASDLKQASDEAALHVVFLQDEPSATLIAGLDPARSLPDQFVAARSEIYLHLPNGAARTKLSSAYFDSKLKTIGTQRNWRTVQTLARMAAV